MWNWAKKIYLSKSISSKVKLIHDQRRVCEDLDTLLLNASVLFLFFVYFVCMSVEARGSHWVPLFIYFFNQSSPYYLRQNLSLNLEFTYVTAAWPMGSVTHLSPLPCCCFVGACHCAWLSDASAGDPHSGPHALWPALYPLSPLNASYLGMIPSLISYLTLSN